MTTAQRMLAHAALAFSLALAGCASTMPREELLAPRVLVAPYQQGRAGQPEVVFAVAPLRNESGVSLVDPLLVTDALVYQFEQVRGVATVPVNRTIGVMRALGLSSIDSPEQAHALIEAIGVDALVVGSITAYDPYDPPKLGLAIGLFARPGALGTPGGPAADPLSQNPSAMNAATTDAQIRLTGASLEPVAFASEHLDAKSHEVQMAVKAFAQGRSDTVSALGWRRYLASMPLYADFASYRLAERLIESERLRLTRALVSGADTTK